jgi:hypothetical protein
MLWGNQFAPAALFPGGLTVLFTGAAPFSAQPIGQPPATPPVPPQGAGATVTQPPTRSGYGKEIATVTKIYTDDQKYSGVDDSFDFKLAIFYDIYNRSSLPPKGYIATFPIMLKGLTQAHYYNYSLSTKPFDPACTYMQNFFKGPEYY